MTNPISPYEHTRQPSYTKMRSLMQKDMDDSFIRLAEQHLNPLIHLVYALQDRIVTLEEQLASRTRTKTKDAE